MTYRTAERIVTWALLATAARSGDNTGPSAPACSSALASQLTLAIDAYASIDPATDGGCVAFPANASAVDSAEYLLVPQSAAPTFGLSSPFALRAATPGAAPMRLAQTLAQSTGPPTPAGQFDGLLRRLGSEHAARADVKTATPGTFAHEFQHMINFAQHTLIQNGAVSEEGWLDEGLSLYAEELTARRYLQAGDTASFSRLAINDVADAYQYLSATGASPLLIEFDQGTLAEKGASWLFARYLVDQYGPALPGKLDQSTLAGAANVAAQTRHAFDTTVTRWALANWVSDLPGFATPVELSYTSWHFRTRTFPSLNQQDPLDFPRPYPLVPTASAGSGVSLSGRLRSGSGVYARALQAPGAAAFTLLFNAGGTAALSALDVPRLSVIRIR